MKNLNIFFFAIQVYLTFNSYNIFPQNVGVSSYIDVNDIYLPFNRKGVIALVNIGPHGSTGQFAGGTFLFSAGFWLSGYSNNDLWVNGVARSSSVEDYNAGTIGMDPNDPKAAIYKITAVDVPFGQSWQDWIDAVGMGADFYDGNGDGVYNPVDLNSNSQWDPDEDMPDLLLDETYWSVYNDGVASSLRRWGAEPQGIEIRQTIFAMASFDELGNVVFVRYRIKNTGLVEDTLKEVYFSVQADADIGDATDDVFGSDSLRNSVYYYNKSSDAVFGNQVPAFMTDMLTGPLSYIPGETYIDVNSNSIYENGIDTPLDTAVNYLGPFGIRIYPGAKNLRINSSAFYVNGDPAIFDPSNITQARNYTFGLTPDGSSLDPCSWGYGQVSGGVPCSQVNPRYWLSGDPVTNYGWIGTQEKDLRGIASVGPFTLVKNQEVEILVGYEVDRSSTPLSGITSVRSVSDAVQIFYKNNFGYPIVSVEDQLPVASNFILEQNYPNPFNPSTKIKFTIPNVETRHASSLQMVTIKVYDILGNEIATLVNEEKPAGSYEVEFNAVATSRDLSLPSGIYFCKLQAGNFIQTKKMVLIK